MRLRVNSTLSYGRGGPLAHGPWLSLVRRRHAHTTGAVRPWCPAGHTLRSASATERHTHTHTHPTHAFLRNGCATKRTTLNIIRSPRLSHTRATNSQPVTQVTLTLTSATSKGACRNSNPECDMGSTGCRLPVTVLVFGSIT